MGFKVTDGMSFMFAAIADMAATKTLTGLSNAAPPVGNSVAHGYANGDELLLDSPWEGITDSVVRAQSVAADTLQLGGLDTSNVNFYAPNGGNGTKVRKILTWHEVPQVETYDPQGGDPVFKTVKLLKRRNANRFPTGSFDPVTINMKLAWDPSQQLWKDLVVVSRALNPVAFKQVLADGSAIYAYGYLIAKETPTQEDSVMKASVQFSSLNLSLSF